MNFDRANALRPRFNTLIPGGGHTYAKGDDQFPERSPGFIARGEGCRVWDEDYAWMQRAATGDESGTLDASDAKQRLDDAELVRRAELQVLARPLWDPAWGAARARPVRSAPCGYLKTTRS